MLVKAAVLTVDDDPAVSQAITRDLRRRYGEEYQIVRATSGQEALTMLEKFALRDRPVALIASDQRMPVMTGVEFLAQARKHAPDAKLVLLTAYADTDVAIKAINDIGLDHYLLKPWDPPVEKLYPIFDDLLSDWREGHHDEAAGVRVVGDRWSEQTNEIKTFLTRNYVPYRWLDIERDEDARKLTDLAHATTADLPLVIIPEAETLRAPSTFDLAVALGLRTSAGQPLYDLCIVGAGPAGLAAAVYGASEGLETVVVEGQAPGGQAGQSAAIENYLGFPRGLSGADLTHRAVAQARRFNAEMVLPRDVEGFETRGPVRAITFRDGTCIETRALLVATGVSYRLLEAPGLGELTGRGVYYGATASDARQCQGDDVYIIGAANSAGQAALNLSRYARRVIMLVRSDALEKSMSQYLVKRIDAADNIEVRVQTEVVSGRGDGHLEAITIADVAAGTEAEVPANWLFVYIGASPRTDWLGPTIARDEKGFIITGQELLARKDTAGWPLSRSPLALETSVPGVFAAGDVRLELDEARRLRRRRRRHGGVPRAPLPGHNLMRIEELRGIYIFAGLTDAQLGELIEVGDEVAFVDGQELFREGEPADFWWVLVDGRIDGVRRSGHEESVVAVLDTPGTWAGGFRAWSDTGGYLLTGRGAGPGRMLRVPSSALGERVHAWFPFAGHLIVGFFNTVRTLEAMARQREALVALGKLAAGLAHEINNPASATARSVDALRDTCNDLLGSLVRLAEASLRSDQFLAIDALRQEIDPSTAGIDPLVVADREEELTTWLTARGIDAAWRIAPTLAAAGVDVAWCERAADVLPGDTLAPGLEWVSSALSMASLLAEMKESTERVSALVGAVKSYSQVDRASMQDIDVTDGLESTLVIMGHKIGDGITVVRAYESSVPRIEANPGELNQVWTNLIDNAIDAMDGRGTLRLSTSKVGDSVVVEVADSGPGMPPEVQARAFDPFYTTKDVGKGTGLGLDISRRIVVERHHGAISIQSQPGATVFRVELPLHRGDVGAGASKP